jgi:hypothetical protein
VNESFEDYLGSFVEPPMTDETGRDVAVSIGWF